MKIAPVAAILSSFLLSVTACSTDPLCDCGLNPGNEEASAVKVDFDWSLDQGANPEGMRIAFHPLDKPDGSIIRFDIPGRDGGVVKLPPGRYAVLAYNNDTETIRFDNLDDWGNAKLNTYETSVTNPLKYSLSRSSTETIPFRPVEDEPVKSIPDKIWGASLGEAEIIGNSGMQSISLMPTPMYCECDFRITHVRNLSRVHSMSVAVTGLADGVNISSGALSTSRCTHTVGAAKKDSTTIAGSFRFFGHNKKDSTPHYLELYVITEDGKGYRFHGEKGSKWDVTKQIENAPDQRHISILVDSLEIPDPSGGGSGDNAEGFTPGVDGWQDVNIRIPI